MENSRFFEVPGSARTFDRNKVLVVLLISLAMTLLQISSVANLLPSIEHSISASTSDVQWILSGYSLAVGVLLVPVGRVGDLYGHSKTWMVGIVVFVLACLIIGTASAPVWVNAGRVLEGIGVGIFSPQAAGIIQHYFSGQARAWAFAFAEFTIAASVAVGPLISGGFVQLFGTSGWRWAFLVNVPLGLIALALGARWLPFSSLDRSAGTADRMRAADRAEAAGRGNDDRRARLDLDLVGVALLVATVLSVMLPEILKVPWRWWIFLATPILAFAWVRWEDYYERTGHLPIMNLRLFKIESYAGGTLITALQFVGMNSVWVVLAIATQQGLGATALLAGLIGLPNAIIESVAGLWAGKHSLRSGRTLQVWALVVILVSVAATIPVAYAVFVHGASIWWLAVPLFVEGLGAGSIGPANQTQTMLDVPASQGGIAGGFRETTQRLTTAIGSAIIMAILFAQVGDPASASRATWFSGFAWSYAAVSVIVAVTLVCAILYRRNGRKLHMKAAA